MADRKAELEKKRKKLEELKKAREQKKNEVKDKVDVCTTARHAVCITYLLVTQVISPMKEPVSSEREDVTKLVDQLLIGETTQPSQSTLSPQPSRTGDPSPSHKTTPTTATATSKQRRLKLVVDQLAPVNIRPRETEVRKIP